MNRAARLLSFLSPWIVAASGALGCGGSLVHQPFTCPEKGGAAWTEVASSHFVLRTDLDAPVAKEVALELETMFSSLADLGFASPFEVRTRMNVVYFRHREEFEKVAPKLTAGVFGMESHDFERTPLAILQGDFTKQTREVIQHELTHLFVHANYPQAPIWLNEGLAQYFQALEVSDGMAILGRPPRRSRFWKGPWAAKIVDGEYTLSIPMSEAPSARSLVSMDFAEFEGAANSDWRTADGQNAIKKLAANYAGAWSLVHLLMTDPAYRPLFDEYQRLLLRGESSDRAWAETLGKVPVEKLQADYTGSLVRFETLTFQTKYTPPPVHADQVRALSEADVHVLWAKLRNWKTADGRAAAEADLKEASAHGRNHPELAEATAYWQEANGNAASAESALNAALAERPNDPRLLNAMGWVEFSAVVGKVRAPEALEPIAAKLGPLAKTAAELDFLAHYSFLHGDVDTALAYEKRAVSADPSCYECYSAAAAMLSERGRVREALQAATLAIGLLPDGRRSPALDAQVATYRRRLSETEPPSPSPGPIAPAPAPAAAAAPTLPKR